MKTLRVCFLSWRDTTHPDGGGAEVFVESVARELVARGHDVTIVCARHPRAPSSGRRAGVTLRHVGGRLTVYLHGLLWVWRHRATLDVVVDSVNGLPFGVPLLRRRGVVGLVHHVHERQWRIIYPGFRGRIGWFVESTVTPRLYRRVPFVTVSEATRSDLVQLGLSPEDVTVAHNGLSSVAGNVKHVAVLPEEGPRLCVLARLVPHKQIEHALEVIRRLSAELPGLQLDVIGDGWWRGPLEGAAERMGVTGRVTFHGHVSTEERDRLLARSWVMLLPSVQEGWGLAVIEAAAQGTPTVAYRWAGGTAESVQDGRTGLLVDDLNDMVDATRRLLTDAGTRGRMSRHARERAVGFTWAATTDVVEKVLLEAARPARPGRRRGRGVSGRRR